MSFYVAAYDTEAVFEWWEPTRSDAAGYDAYVSYEGESLETFLAGARAVAEAHLATETPATFFIVAKLLDHCGSQLRAILDHPSFDLQCHSYTHPDLIRISTDEKTLRYELIDSKKRIEDTFGRPIIGLTAPGGYTRGFSGQTFMLDLMAEAGYRYMRTYGAGPNGTVPAPLHQPFWYAEDGHPDLLEIPSHAWHDIFLSGQPGIVHWPPVLPWAYPTEVPTDAEGVYAAYAPGIEHAAAEDLLTYIPIFHPWSIHRIDQQAKQISLLLEHAQSQQQIASCTKVYEYLCAHRAQASDHPPH